MLRFLLVILLLPQLLLGYRDMDDFASLEVEDDDPAAVGPAMQAGKRTADAKVPAKVPLAASKADSKLEVDEATFRSELSAACLQIMQAVHKHVTELAPAGEKQFVRQTSMVSGLEKYGVPLEKQVQLFALTQLGLLGPGGKGEEDEVITEENDPREDLEEEVHGNGEDLEEERPGIGEDFEEDDGPGIEEDGPGIGQETVEKPGLEDLNPDALGKKTVGPDENMVEEEEEQEIDDEEGESEVVQEDENVASERLEAYMGNTGETVDETAVKSFNDAYTALSKLTAEHAKMPLAKAPLSKVDPLEYRMKQLKKRDTDFKKWSKQMADAVKPYLAKPEDSSALTKQERLAKMSEVTDALQTLGNRLSDMHTAVRAKRDVDWMSVTEHIEKHWAKRFWEWSKNQVVGWYNGAKKMAKRIWMAFVSTTQKTEEKCVEEHKKREKEVMDDAKMDSEATANVMVSGGSMDEKQKVLDEEMNKAEGAINKAQERAGVKEGELERQAESLKKAGDMIEQDATKGNMKPEDVDELGKDLEAVSDTACEAKEWSLTASLKQLWEKAKVLEKRMAPQIGYRGIGGSVSVLGGGIEEVLDLWNKEIGIFTWGQASIGMSSGTAGVSGYAGFGWKGYKLDWNLQDAYQTSKSVTVGVSASFPFPVAGFSYSATLSLDADASVKPWVVDEPGLHGIAIGWGLSMGLSLPVPYSVDVGMASYSMFHSECYDTLSSFLGAIWLPHCRNCTGTAQKLTVLGARSAIKVGAFPILSDLVFSYLAWRADASRHSNAMDICQNRSKFRPCMDGTFNPDLIETFRCSPISTKFHQSIRHQSRLVASQIEGFVIQLTRLHIEFERVMASIEKSLAAGNKEVFVSKDWMELLDVLEGEEVGCLSAPVETTPNLAPGKTIKPKNTEHSEEYLQTLDGAQLKEMCKAIPACKAKMGFSMFYGKDDAVRDLADTYKEASKANKFGACTSSSTCVTATGRGAKCDCKNVKHGFFQNLKKMVQDCPSHSGRCICGPNSCFKKGAGCVAGSMSVEDQSGVTKLRSAFKEWLFARHIELGSFAVRFQELVQEEH